MLISLSDTPLARKMRMRKIALISLIPLSTVSQANAATLPCPPMPAAVTESSRDVKADVNLSIGSLGKLKAGQVGVKAESLATNLLSKHPNFDKSLALQMMASTYCGMLNSMSMSDEEKLNRWETFQDKVLQLAERPAVRRQGAETAARAELNKPESNTPSQRPRVELLSVNCRKMSPSSSGPRTTYTFSGRATSVPVDSDVFAAPVLYSDAKVAMTCPGWTKTSFGNCTRRKNQSPDVEFSGTVTATNAFVDEKSGKIKFIAGVQAGYSNVETRMLSCE
jgi:hypothetical protein